MSLIRVLAKVLNSDTMLRMQSVQNSEKIPLSGTAPAGGIATARSAISNYGDFLCLFITGTFETLKKVTVEAADYIIDDGVDYLRGQLADSIGQRKLFTDYIPFSLWVTPGRRRSSNVNVVNTYRDDATTGANASPASNFLFYPHEFEYIFAATGEIQLSVYNDSNVDLNFDLCFHGVRIISDKAVSNASAIRASL